MLANRYPGPFGALDGGGKGGADDPALQSDGGRSGQVALGNRRRSEADDHRDRFAGGDTIREGRRDQGVRPPGHLGLEAEHGERDEKAGSPDPHDTLSVQLNRSCRASS